MFTVSGSTVSPRIRLALRCSPATNSVMMKSSSGCRFSERTATPSEAQPHLGLITYESASSEVPGTAIPFSDRICEQMSLSAHFLTDSLGQPRLTVLSSTIAVRSESISSGAMTIPASQVRAILSTDSAKSQSPPQRIASPQIPAIGRTDGYCTRCPHASKLFARVESMAHPSPMIAGSPVATAYSATMIFIRASSICGYVYTMPVP